MKRLLLTSLLILAALLGMSQKELKGSISLEIGLNSSYYGQGDVIYKGIRHAEQGFIGGIIYNAPISYKFSLESSVLYSHMGAKNPKEYYNSPDRNTNFSTYGIFLPITLNYKIKSLSFKGGGYVSRNVYAQNREFFGGGFGWDVKRWDYFHKYNAGVKAGLSIDLVPVSVNLVYLYGITDVRKNYEKYGNRMKGNKDVAINLTLSCKL